MRTRFRVPSASALVQKTVLLYTIYKNNQTSYLSNIVLQGNSAFNNRNVDKVPLFKIENGFYKLSNKSTYFY